MGEKGDCDDETAAAGAVQQTPSLNIINSGLVHNNKPCDIIDDTDQTNNNDTATVSKAGPETESSENKMNLVCGTETIDNSEAGGGDNKAVSGLTPDPALTSVLPHTFREQSQCTQSSIETNHSKIFAIEHAAAMF